MASALFGRDWPATAVLLGWAVGSLAPTAAARTANPPNFVVEPLMTCDGTTMGPQTSFRQRPLTSTALPVRVRRS